MPTEIDSRVTPTLHAETLKALDGFDDSTMPYIAPAIEALDDAYQTLGKLHDGRDAASLDGGAASAGRIRDSKPPSTAPAEKV